MKKIKSNRYSWRKIKSEYSLKKQNQIRPLNIYLNLKSKNFGSKFIFFNKKKLNKKK